MADTAAQVPGVFDLIIDGHGYITARAVDPNLPFRVQQQSLSYTPTFLERTNVSGNYGDDSQAFWMTESQNDWSLGEQRRFYHPRQDPDNARRYWQGTNVDVLTPGQVTLRQKVKSISVGASVRACSPRGQAVSQNLVAAGTTNLYEIDPAGAVTDRGAHGLGAAPSKYGVCTDGTDVYLTTTAGGTVGVRRMTGSSTFSTFSASGADAIAYLNNAVYGLRASDAKLVQWDTGGTQSTIYTWQRGQGSARGGIPLALEPFGAQLAILWADGQKGSELWLYAGGAAPTLAMQIDSNFVAQDILVAGGTIFISGAYIKLSGGSTSTLTYRPAIYYWANGSEGILWQANAYYSSTVGSVAAAGFTSLAAFQTGIIFNDDTTGTLLHYEFATGGIHTIGSYTVAGDTPLLAASQQALLMTRNQATAYAFPDTSAFVASGTVITSLMDIESSLPKLLRGIQVDVDLPTGSSVDIAYQVDGLDGSWTTLQTGAAAGTEYVPGSTVTFHSLAIRVTLNLGSASSSPTLKRIFLRAVPRLKANRLNEYILDLGGDAVGCDPVRLRNDAEHALTGEQMRTNLAAAITATAPISVTDRTGTFTAVLEPAGCEFDLTRPGQWYARIRAREV